MTLLAARGLAVSLGATRVLDGVDLDVAAGEVVGLIGPNGAGKTTALRTLAGLLRPAQGDIRLDGTPLTAIGRAALARAIAYLPQHGPCHWPLTVAHLVMTGRAPHIGPWRGPGAADREAVSRAMAACDVATLAERPMDRLSGGEQTRVLLARALAVEPRLLLADEPIAGLDPAHQLDILGRLRQRAASGTGIVVVMHDLTLAARFCDRLVLLFAASVAAEGEPALVLSPDNLARCYGIRAHYGSVDGNPIVVPMARTPVENADDAG